MHLGMGAVQSPGVLQLTVSHTEALLRIGPQYSSSRRVKEGSPEEALTCRHPE